MKALMTALALTVLMFPALQTTAEGEEVSAPCTSNKTMAPSKAAWPNGPGYSGTTCTFDWVDISTTGTEIQLADDDYEGPFDLGFSFPLYRRTWTQAYISSNGFVRFDSGSSNSTNECPILSEFGPTFLVAALWDDLDPGDTQDPIFYEAFDTCPKGNGRCFVVQWQDICHFPGGPDCLPGGTFQAIVYESGDVIVQILDAGLEAGEGSTTGIVGADLPADHSLTYACNQADSLTDQLCLKMEPAGRLYAYEVGGVAHVSGSQGTSWRSSLSVTNTSGRSTGLVFTFIEAGNETTANATVADGEIMEWDDVTESLFGLGRNGSGSIKIDSDTKLSVTVRTYNQTDEGTFGQYLPGLREGTGLPPNEIGILPHLKSNADFRTNIGFFNLSGMDCQVRFQLHDHNGHTLGDLTEVTVKPFGWTQLNRVFQTLGAQSIAYATVELGSQYCRAWAYASVVDENTGDPTTIPVEWGQ